MTHTFTNLTQIVDTLQAEGKKVKVIKLKSQFNNKRRSMITL